MLKQRLPYFILALLAAVVTFFCWFRPFEFYPIAPGTDKLGGYRLNRLTGALFVVRGEEEEKVNRVDRWSHPQSAAVSGEGSKTISPELQLLRELFLHMGKGAKRKPETLPLEDPKRRPR